MLWNYPIAAAVAAAALAAAQPASAAMAVPFATPAPRSAPLPADCGQEPAPMGALQAKAMYKVGDQTYSQLDPQRAQDMKAQLQPIQAFTWGVAKFANAYMASGGSDVRSGACALAWLRDWAQAGAMMTMQNHDAQFLRAVNLSGWAIDFAQVRGITLQGNDPRPLILQWFTQMAHDTQAHFDTLTSVPARNNHRYWAGLAAAAVAMDSGDRGLASWGFQSATIGLRQINAAGALPLELARVTRARQYHIYAAAPLVLTAEIAAANGVDLYGTNDHALDRLVSLALQWYADPAKGAALVAAPQEAQPSPKQMLAWVEFYNHRFPGKAPGVAQILAQRPLINAETGGNMTLLAAKAH